MNTLIRRLLTGTAAVAAAAAISLSGTAAANAATPTASASSTSSTGVPFRSVSAHAIRAQYGTVPAALGTDLKAVRGKKGADRKAAAESIESKALDGTYGADVKTAATDAKTAWSAAPASFKSAVRAARKSSGTDRAKDFAALETKALAGGYGTPMENYAKTVQSNVQKQQAASLKTRSGAVL